MPVIVAVLAWTWDGLVLGPGVWQFWYRSACAALLLAPFALVAVLAVRSGWQRLRAWIRRPATAA